MARTVQVVRKWPDHGLIMAQHSKFHRKNDLYKRLICWRYCVAIYASFQVDQSMSSTFLARVRFKCLPVTTLICVLMVILQFKFCCNPPPTYGPVHWQTATTMSCLRIFIISVIKQSRTINRPLCTNDLRGIFRIISVLDLLHPLLCAEYFGQVANIRCTCCWRWCYWELLPNSLSK
jgi:hypothetical protein